jgi:hypothetical protein
MAVTRPALESAAGRVPPPRVRTESATRMLSRGVAGEPNHCEAYQLKPGASVAAVSIVASESKSSKNASRV